MKRLIGELRTSAYLLGVYSVEIRNMPDYQPVQQWAIEAKKASIAELERKIEEVTAAILATAK